ncbi:telomerase reverse transcriptase isoform X2 [Sesamum indicum]|uniref:Telomerase reverse transcriptase n=1 Tax=Sesamum indicum TaxID=4182 RepID=A0A8M8V2D4_SESIN|nr:telomerase reverse transcriptase isoform X2 [Sesamum indicum]
MARKRKRVPEVLWRLFRHRARSLAETILALIPPPPATASGCRCKGPRCLYCSGEEVMSFLVRPDDPSDYRKLLTGCFVVVSENAPPLPVFDPHCRWSQCEIVRRSIEMIMHEVPSSSNLICCSYDKDNRSSAVVDELTSPKWTILLRRVGDALMMYLLKYTSLFLPLPRNKHHQISGSPISDFCFKFSRRMPDFKSQHHPLVCNGSRQKRKRIEVVESEPGKQPHKHSSGSDPASDSNRFVASDGSGCGSNEERPHKISEGSLKQNTGLSQKRTRQYLWQRQRKCRQLVQETNALIPCSANSCNRDNMSRRLQYDVYARSSLSYESKISPCFCCSVFQNVRKMHKNAEINRQHIFYKLQNSTSMFPAKHLLYALKPNGSGASVLFNNIFGTFGSDNPEKIACLHSQKSHRIISTCLYHSFIKLLKRLIRETRSCRYLRLLNKHCSIRSPYQDASRSTTADFEGNDKGANLSMRGQDEDQIDKELSQFSKTKKSKTITEASVNQLEPSKCYCPKKQVVSFIWAICRRIVPSPLLGEPSNWRILRRNISKFIQLRKFEKFSLKECIHELKISKFPLLSNKHHADLHGGCSEVGISDIARHAILECWMYWFFMSLVSPLVKANFYVTESEHEKQEVLYYRKSTWKKLMRETECMKDERYHLLNHASAREILGKRPFGFSRARLRPKQIGFRMLTNLRAPSRMPLNPPPSRNHSIRQLQSKALYDHGAAYQSFQSVNSVLHDLHVVLKGLWTKEPEKLGSSVFDYNDVYRKLVPYLFLLKNGPTDMPSVFIVVSDVSKAFDSVNQDKLLSVMKDVIFDDEYTVEKFTQVIHAKKSLKVHQHLTLAHKEIVTESRKNTSRLPSQSLHSVLVKKVFSKKIRKEEINLILIEHIMRNVVQFDNKFYLQLVGIPQGSVLSSLLCSFYYGHMERNVVFPFLEKANGDFLGKYDTFGASASQSNHTNEVVVCGAKYLLLRFIDDFLFISTSKKQASMFFSRLERGIRDYNCWMNDEKFGLNFDINGQGCRSNRLHVGKDGTSFLRWSGVLVNCSTLEIQADYTRYNFHMFCRYLNSHLSSTLTVSCRGKVGCQLKAKLRRYLQPKCHPLFYDSNINSPGVVRLNIYQAFLLCAMKFVCYISKLSILPRFCPIFCINAISASLRYMSRLIKRKVYSFDIDNTFRPKYDVKKKDVIWLGLHAYSRVFQKKQSRHKKLLCLFRSRLKPYGRLENMSPELKYAVDDARSSVLWSIKY